MCDWDEAEYAEYLLWLEAAKVRTRSEGKRVSVGGTPSLSEPIEVSAAPAAA